MFKRNYSAACIGVRRRRLTPFPGPPLVYVAMAVCYFLIKDFQMGIIILVFGAIFITLIPSNIIAPQLALKTSRIHPILTLLAFIAPIFVWESLE
jgi:predicted PurR-regulated permease PerM